MMTFTHSNTDLQGNLVSSVVYTVYDVDAGIHDVMQEFRRFLLAASFHPDTVDEYIEAE